jgi:formylmethanofuran dehydrogenase subunit C
MIMERMAVRRKMRVTGVAAIKRFRRYKDEEGKTGREYDATETKGLKSIMEAWEGYDYDLARSNAAEKGYGRALSLLEGLEFSAGDVAKFSMMLKECEQEPRFSKKAGLFLSAAINNGSEGRYTVYAGALVKSFDCFGYRNSKDIAVIGDLGRMSAGGMERGSIVIHGKAGESLGYCNNRMRGGTIVVKGDTGGVVGYYMEGGEIIIDGDAKDCGQSMSGGRITIGGDVSGDVGKFLQEGTITVLGDAKGYVGSNMEGGEIIVEGNVKYYWMGRECGPSMKGGSITIGGNVPGDIGWSMEGGSITILGDAKGCVGPNMREGEIHIHGKMGRIGDVKGGRIYHKGKLIVDK